MVTCITDTHASQPAELLPLTHVPKVNVLFEESEEEIQRRKAALKIHKQERRCKRSRKPPASLLEFFE